MTSRAAATPRWSTSSFPRDDAGKPSFGELSGLREHLGACHGARGRWFTLQCLAETMNGFVAGRMVTTLTLATVVLAIGLGVSGWIA
jgi:hypothetical protein